MACKAKPKAQIDILAVAKKILIEPADGLQSGCAVKCSGRTRGKDFFILAGSESSPGLEVGCTTHQAAEVVFIPCPVEEAVIGVEKLNGSEGGALGMAMRGLEKMLQPLRLGIGIGIEQGDPIGFCFREGEVVGGGKAEIAARGNNAKIRQEAAECGAFDGLGIIHQKDSGGLESLRAEAVKATRQRRERLPIDDDDGDLASAHFKEATGWRSWGEANHGLPGLAQPSALGMREEAHRRWSAGRSERARAMQMIPRAGLAEK